MMYWIFEYWDGYRLVKTEIVKTHEAYNGIINSKRECDLRIKLIYDI